MVKLEDLPKRDFLAVPIEMFKAEIIIKKNRKLTEFEKTTLKLIEKQPSLKTFIEAFNVGPFIMNNILAKLFYRGLIQLKLDVGSVQLTKKILDFVKKDKLDEFIDEAPISEIRKIRLIQEKISGELFTENKIREFFKNPGELTTNYYDLKAAPPDKFPNLLNLSLSKKIKCIRTEIKTDPSDVENVKLIRPMHRNRLYIPLVTKKEIKQLDLNYETFPRHVQKAWLNAYDVDYNLKGDTPLEIFSEEPHFISNKIFKVRFLQNLILLEQDINNYLEKESKLTLLKPKIEENYEYLLKMAKIFRDKIKSINHLEVNIKGNDYQEFLSYNLTQANKVLCICSSLLNERVIPFITPLIDSTLKRDVIIILIWGNHESYTLEESKGVIKNFINLLKQKLSQNTENLIIIRSKVRSNSNFILIDFQKIILNITEFLNWDYNNESIIPSISIEGGYIPLEFFEFCLNLLPRDLPVRLRLEDYLIEELELLCNGLSEERFNFLNDFENRINELENDINLNNGEDAINTITRLKDIVKKIDLFETSSLIKDMEHEDILLDAMKEINNEFFIYTNEIHREMLGPHLDQAIDKIMKLEIKLNKKFSISDETQWNLGEKQLNKFLSGHSNFHYEINERDYVLNMFYVKENFAVFTDFKFLTKMKGIDYRNNLKCLGLIIYSPKIDDLAKEIFGSLE
jgi:hypothetical protein